MDFSVYLLANLSAGWLVTPVLRASASSVRYFGHQWENEQTKKHGKGILGFNSMQRILVYSASDYAPAS